VFLIQYIGDGAREFRGSSGKKNSNGEQKKGSD